VNTARGYYGVERSYLGYLLLGSAEAINDRGKLRVPISKHCRVIRARGVCDERLDLLAFGLEVRDLGREVTI